MPKSFASTASRWMAGSMGFGEDLVQRIGQPLAGTDAIHGDVLVPVGNPDVGHGRRAQLAPHLRADLAAGDAVLDPEIADALVRVG